jgi:DNA-binding IclR family transcriptional regulator
MDSFNKLKLRTLEIFSRSGPIRPADYMVRAKFYPLAAAHTYLIRLKKMGLLAQGEDARGRHLYALTERGAQRLSWLRARMY